MKQVMDTVTLVKVYKKLVNNSRNPTRGMEYTIKRIEKELQLRAAFATLQLGKVHQ